MNKLEKRNLELSATIEDMKLNVIVDKNTGKKYKELEDEREKN